MQQNNNTQRKIAMFIFELYLFSISGQSIWGRRWREWVGMVGGGVRARDPHIHSPTTTDTTRGCVSRMSSKNRALNN